MVLIWKVGRLIKHGLFEVNKAAAHYFVIKFHVTIGIASTRWRIFNCYSMFLSIRNIMIKNAIYLILVSLMMTNNSKYKIISR